MHHYPHVPAAPGAWPKKSPHTGRGTPREPRCRPSYARDPIPAATRGIGRAWSPAGAVCLVAMSVRPADPRDSVFAVTAHDAQAAIAAETPPEPASPPWPSTRHPPRSGRVRRFLRVTPRPGSPRGHFRTPPGRLPPDLHARIRDTPCIGTPPGAMAAESHRRGHRPVPRARRSATGRTPEERRGIALEAPKDR